MQLGALVDGGVLDDAGGLVAFFASRDHELSTTPLDEHLRRGRHRRCLPRITFADGAEALEFVAVDDGAPISSLPRDRFGIPTPQGHDVVSLARCDVVVVPGLAFDRGGGRLGYGRGFYDRALVGVDDAAIVGGLGNASTGGRRRIGRAARRGVLGA